MSVDSAASAATRAETRSAAAAAEWAAAPLRPVAHWMIAPDGAGRSRLTCVWQVPDPMPPA